MLKKTTIAVAAIALMLAAASSAQASKDDSGDYKGGALFGPLPGQMFNYGSAPGGAYAGGAYAYAYAPRTYGRGGHAFGYAPRMSARGGRAFGYATSPRVEFPTAPWEEY